MNKPMKTAKPYKTQPEEIFAIQADQLVYWKGKLDIIKFNRLKAHVERQNKLWHESGKSWEFIFRGKDIEAFISKLRP